MIKEKLWPIYAVKYQPQFFTKDLNLFKMLSNSGLREMILQYIIFFLKLKVVPAEQAHENFSCLVAKKKQLKLL